MTTGPICKCGHTEADHDWDGDGESCTAIVNGWVLSAANAEPPVYCDCTGLEPSGMVQVADNPPVFRFPVPDVPKPKP